ncbi:hypothetical protein HTZ97_13835 [Desulfuromonas acetoxidans]|uniref:Uncharacterized protein n=1 Tax=Desulfuromonas acetoxidans (strain DSM 684 / 11070) TaxID=281689 RepID=Q1K177_DESA6|nr:hypothetical protein [Desulfuromonas acetoxidans]EAT16131.1 hypothetical protein Dace_1595 [Desulfuromonas acetoxidans DSM 684]MBF0646437.1 hypothetical protein [Desulfuromonas acetoxidans]NVD25516.1 hypothetical protein [Desulfuromonas acetoxidans]NVE17534.1 hypothetical protein [Desulfuromonas acetoxidans]
MSAVFVLCPLNSEIINRIRQLDCQLVFTRHSSVYMWKRAKVVDNVSVDYRNEHETLKRVVSRMYGKKRSKGGGVWNILSRSLVLSEVKAEVRTYLNCLESLKEVERETGVDGGEVIVYTNYLVESDLSNVHSRKIICIHTFNGRFKVIFPFSRKRKFLRRFLSKVSGMVNFR